MLPRQNNKLQFEDNVMNRVGPMAYRFLQACQARIGRGAIPTSCNLYQYNEPGHPCKK